MAKLHPTQIALLHLLRKNIDNPLTVRDLQDRLDISSTSVVQHHIEQLEKKGFLKRNPLNPKDYQIMTDPEKPVAYLNLYGLAECGPNGSILDGAPIERIPIATRLLSFPANEAFLVEAKGDSMIPKINPGDLVIVRKTNNAVSGDIVVCVNDSKVLIKKYITDGNKIILHSENSLIDPFLASESFTIEGVVKGVFQYN